MHNINLILTLAGCFSAALVFGYITQRMHLSPIVGYLLAGIIVGPHTPGFEADPAMAEQLAEIGVILLMFGVGLQFHIEELLAVRRVALPGAIGQIAVATFLGILIAYAFGWSTSSGIVFGIALSVASTVVLIRILADNRELHTPTGHIAVGWLVVEDIFTIVVLVLLPTFFSPEATGTDLFLMIGITALKVGALLACTVYLGNRAIPYLLDLIAATRSRELFTLAVLTVALGIAVGSSVVFDVSMALGAFLAGMVVGRSDFSLRAATEALPMRDAFAVLFFVSVGMLLDPGQVLETPMLILATVSVVVIGKPLAALVIVRLLGYPFRTALAVAVALAQIGEFSFILSSVARDLKILDIHATNALVAASIISILLNPLLFRLVTPIHAWVSTRPKLSRWLDPAPKISPTIDDHVRESNAAFHYRAIVVGYGPGGQILTRLLRDNGIEPTVVELNVDTVRALREEGMSAVYGDVIHRDTLLDAGVVKAGYLILTSASMGKSDEVVRAARELNPNIQVLARTNYLKEVQALKHVGADKIFSAEGEVALALTAEIMHQLGATPEQVDNERQRVQTELFTKFVDGSAER